MPDWNEYVRRHLSLPELTREREEQIREDLALQFEQTYTDARARGLSEADAEAAARAHVPDWDSFTSDVYRSERRHAKARLDRWEEQTHDRSERRGVLRGWLNDLRRDVLYGLRTLRKNPGFTTVAILTLALGIGATVSVFTVFNGVLLRPLPYPDQEDLVLLMETDSESSGASPRGSVAPANFRDWSEQSSTIARMAAFTDGTYSLTGDLRPELVTGQRVSGPLFGLLGIDPAIGRTFRPEEDRIGAPPVVVLSHPLWQRRFGSDPGILDQPVILDEHPYTVIGVMPPDFAFPSPETQLWVPAAFTESENRRGSHFVSVIGRLRQGASLPQARAELDAIGERLARAYPQSNSDVAVRIVPLKDAFVEDARTALSLLLGMVGMLLLLSCANVANLLLARGQGRERELAVRTAIGAGRGRLVRQLMTESLLLGLLGGAAGLAVAGASTRVLGFWFAGDLPRSEAVTIDVKVLGFAVLVSLVSSLVFGSFPALRLVGRDLRPMLKQIGGAQAHGTRSGVQNVLAIAQVALALVLLTGATLLTNSFLKLQAIDPGFDAAGVLTMKLALTAQKYARIDQRTLIYDQITERIGSLPGVESVGLVGFLPLDSSGGILGLTVEGRPVPAAEQAPRATYRVVSAGYFHSLKIPLRRGRLFAEGETRSNPFVAVIDEEMARRYWPDSDAVGQRLKFGGPDSSQPWVEVIGVVGETRQFGLERDPAPGIYVPFAQPHARWAAPRALVIRAGTGLDALAGTVREEIWSLDPDMPISDVRTMIEIVAASVAPQRNGMLLTGALGLTALLMAMVGVYGVLAFLVAQCTHEIGLRMALGARPRDALLLVLRRGIVLTLTGAVIGLVAALGLTRFLEGLLFGLSPFDSTSYAVTMLLLLGVAFLACWIPARRATKVDPMVALRYE